MVEIKIVDCKGFVRAPYCIVGGLYAPRWRAIDDSPRDICKLDTLSDLLHPFAIDCIYEYMLNINVIHT